MRFGDCHLRFSGVHNAVWSPFFHPRHSDVFCSFPVCSFDIHLLQILLCTFGSLLPPPEEIGHFGPVCTALTKHQFHAYQDDQKGLFLKRFMVCPCILV